MQDDVWARREALAPDRSFIVRAPAGSGKTELLTQRFLGLLATVDAPEQIVALTFTRKAAAEMRDRILKQLTLALTELPADAPAHQRTTWQLAKSVLAQDRLQGWDLLQQPQRLRLLTIDALCADLIRQLPLASGLVQAQIHDQPSELYELAIQELFADLDEATPWQDALHTLLSHCDNRLDHLGRLCQRLLAEREQWLPLMAAAQDDPARLKQLLEANFQSIVVEASETVDRLLAIPHKSELLRRLQMAAELAQKRPERYHVFRTTSEWPAPSIDNHLFWQHLALVLLTDEGQLRQRLDINCGFPPPSKAPDAATRQQWQHHKEAMQELLAEFRADSALLPALQNLALAPNPYFDEQEWPLCKAIFAVLPALLVYWRWVCEKHGQIDFAEISWRARIALGEAENPSDLALLLDYRVQHWLIDEFQDTSLAQFDLLKALTAGWQAGDGRTLFLVGDPLQSIYRFRQAEVSLFWQVWHHGLAGLPVEALSLTQNFRSQAGLIAWFNDALAPLFPLSANWQVGAVPYTQVVAAREEGVTPAVVETTVTEEAEAVVAILQQELAVAAGRSIAILVKARSHLTALLPALQRHKMAYRAVELAALAQQPVVKDVLSLLRALLCRHDRLAWAAVLRAPWGGALSLVDWQRIVGADSSLKLWPWCDEGITEAGRQHLARIRPILHAALQGLHRQSLSQCLEQAWQELGGEAYWSSASSQLAAERFFALLRQHEQAGDLIDLARFERLLASTYLEEVEAAAVEIMTVHKAKGLEFDVVILPGQDRRSANDDAPLFAFDSLASASGARWLLAPMKAAHVKQEPRYDFLRHLQQQKSRHEQQRLFYVACTRARQRLHLLRAKADAGAD